MASIHTKSEQQLIELLPDIELLELPYGFFFWIGLIRYEHDFLVWSDGSPLNYTNWYPGEPSKIDNELSNCVEIWDRHGWKWYTQNW